MRKEDYNSLARNKFSEIPHKEQYLNTENSEARLWEAQCRSSKEDSRLEHVRTPVFNPSLPFTKHREFFQVTSEKAPA